MSLRRPAFAMPCAVPVPVSSNYPGTSKRNIFVGKGFLPVSMIMETVSGETLAVGSQKAQASYP